MIVTIGGVKGGSGKTTIATNLAVMRSQTKRVLLVDADLQKSSSKFAFQRDSENIPTTFSTIELCSEKMNHQIQRLKPNYDDIIIDCGAIDTNAQRSCLLVTDMYLIPFKPSCFDIWTMGDVRKMVSGAKAWCNFNALAFLNCADARGSDNDDALDILKDCEEFECLKLTIGNRKAFRTSASDGLSVTEMKNPDKKAIQEITDFYEYIYKNDI